MEEASEIKGIARLQNAWDLFCRKCLAVCTHLTWVRTNVLQTINLNKFVSMLTLIRYSYFPTDELKTACLHLPLSLVWIKPQMGFVVIIASYRSCCLCQKNPWVDGGTCSYQLCNTPLNMNERCTTTRKHDLDLHMLQTSSEDLKEEHFFIHRTEKY